MAVAVEKVVMVALDRIKSAMAEVQAITAYNSGEGHKTIAMNDLDVASELLALIVQPLPVPPQPAPTVDVTA
jgi:hypothetical protein